MASLRTFKLARLKPYRSFAALLISTFLVECFAIGWKWSFYKTAFWNCSRSNLWIYNGFLVIRLLLYLHLFYHSLVSKKLKRIILYATIPLLVFGILNYFFIQQPNEENSYSILADHLFIIALSLLFFNQVLKDSTIIKLNSNPMVWISLGTFIYFSGSLPFFIVLGLLNKSNVPLAYSLLYVNTALNTLMYTFYLISFLCRPHIQK